MDGNTGTQQYNMQYTRLLRFYNNISTIKILPHQRHLLLMSSRGKPGRILIPWRNSRITPSSVDWDKLKVLIGFCKNDIIPSMSQNLCLANFRRINKYNDTLHKRFVKHDIYNNIHCIHNQSIYSLPTHLARAFERLDKLITRLTHAADKKKKKNNRLGEMVAKI